MGTNGSKGANATCSWTPWGWWWPVGSTRLLAGLQSGFPRIRMVMADAGYESRKLARELKRRHGWRLHITKRRQRAFKVVGLTWIVERTFAWLARNRRLSKDYELKVQTSEAFIDLAAIRLMLKRLAPRENFSNTLLIRSATHFGPDFAVNSFSNRPFLQFIRSAKCALAPPIRPRSSACFSPSF